MRKLADENRRKEAITVLFTKQEKDQVIRAALDRGIAPSLLLRSAALNLCASKEASAA